MILSVYRATDVVTCEGVMIGEPISFADELILDDVFRRKAGCTSIALDVLADANGLHRADANGAPIHLDCCLTFMAPGGSTVEAVVLVETSGASVAEVFILPLDEFGPAIDYRLVGVARHTATKRFAENACGAFARGTRITLADGRMRAIEDLRTGDMILTRDAGPQPIAHVGHATSRAKGQFAPVVITQGALNNEADLIVRPDHRLFVYQRRDHIGAGRAEVLVKARDLVNGSTVLRRRGGYVDYFQLTFAQHQLIYAEGIAAESRLVDPHSRALLADDVALPDHQDQPYLAYEVTSNLIPLDKAAALLKKASSR